MTEFEAVFLLFFCLSSDSWDQESSSLDHQLNRFFVNKRSMFNRADACQDSLFNPLSGVRMCHNRHTAPTSFLNGNPDLFGARLDYS